MGIISKRKFGIKRININIEQGNALCIDCGHRAGLHYGDTWECPNLPKKERIIAYLKKEREL